jgi:hypothetical protein
MEPQEETAAPSLQDLLAHTDRLLAEAQKQLAQIDERRRLERGEDGFDG